MKILQFYDLIDKEAELAGIKILTKLKVHALSKYGFSSSEAETFQRTENEQGKTLRFSCYLTDPLRTAKKEEPTFLVSMYFLFEPFTDAKLIKDITNFSGLQQISSIGFSAGMHVFDLSSEECIHYERFFNSKKAIPGNNYFKKISGNLSETGTVDWRNSEESENELSVETLNNFLKNMFSKKRISLASLKCKSIMPLLENYQKC